MSKRLVRIKPAHIKEHLHDKAGTEINAVMKDGKTFFGKLQSATDASLELLDTRDHRHTLPVSGIYEVIYDHNSL